ncbi:hypothetical protein [Algivirga pacifica]|uniref:Uncharacterized protein n=1 Tax=Algivirga pacifica TaxID=1162670 RepID=A0ABP9DLT7_9BACT
MEQIKEEEKIIIGKSFLSVKLAAFLLDHQELEDETRLLHIHRATHIPIHDLVKAYQQQQILIEKHLNAFIDAYQPQKEEELPPLISKWVNPSMLEYYMYEEEVGDYIVAEEQKG